MIQPRLSLSSNGEETLHNVPIRAFPAQRAGRVGDNHLTAQYVRWLPLRLLSNAIPASQPLSKWLMQ